MGVIGYYELLPRYTDRPAPDGTPHGFIWAYSITCTSVIFVVPHHLFMDFAPTRVDGVHRPGALVGRRASGILRHRLFTC